MVKKIVLTLFMAISIQFCLAQEPIRYYANEKVGYKNQDGDIIINANYEAGSDFKNGVAIVILNGKRGLINTQGNYLLPLAFEDITYPDNGMIVAKQNGKYGVLNMQNNWVIQPMFDVAYSWVNGYARIKKNNKWGFIKSDKIEIPTKMFEAIGDFQYNLAPVCINHKWGFMNQKGLMQLANTYDIANSFNTDGTAIVTKNSKTFLINTKGIVIKQIIDKKIEEEMEEYQIKTKHKKK